MPFSSLFKLYQLLKFMSVYTALGEALQALLAGGFVGSAGTDLYSSWKADKVNRSYTPFAERLISAIAAGLYFDIELIVRTFRFLVWIGAMSVVTVVNLTKWICGLVRYQK